VTQLSNETIRTWYAFMSTSRIFFGMTEVILHSLVALQVSDQITCTRVDHANKDHQISIIRGLVGRKGVDGIEVLTSFEIPRTTLETQFIHERSEMYKGIVLDYFLTTFAYLDVFLNVELVGFFLVDAGDIHDEFLTPSLDLAGISVIIRSGSVDILSARAEIFHNSLKYPARVSWKVSESENYSVHSVDRAAFGRGGPLLNESVRKARLSHERMLSAVSHLEQLIDPSRDTNASYDILRKVHFVSQCLRNLSGGDPVPDKSLCILSETAALTRACTLAHDIASFLEKKAPNSVK
jgi:hypothetical protein